MTPNDTGQKPADNSDRPSAGDEEVLETGQEEVSSRTAIERGLVKDPKAMDPKDVRHPGDGR